MLQYLYCQRHTFGTAVGLWIRIKLYLYPRCIAFHMNGCCFIFFRYVLNNGSLYFTSIKSSGIFPDPGLYKCIAEVPEGNEVHRIATPQVTLKLAGIEIYSILF